MSKTNRRRKTICSAAEIENFLEELNPPVPCKAAHMLEGSDSQLIAGVEPSSQLEDVIKPIKIQENSPIVSVEASSSPADLITGIGGSQSISEVARQEDIEAQYIRDFCKIMNNPQEKYHEMCELGRLLRAPTKYTLLPSRALYPENYSLPASSMEAKRELLMSLSPMLTQADVQRKLDAEACQNFTRCRVEKGHGRFASYEYIDIDTHMMVAMEEYERRYLQYIAHSKRHYGAPGERKDRASDLLILTNSGNNSLETKQELSVSDGITTSESRTDAVSDESVATLPPSEMSTSDLQTKQKKNGKPPKARRVTLSPASARALMLKAMEAEEAQEAPTDVADVNSASSSGEMQEENCSACTVIEAQQLSTTAQPDTAAVAPMIAVPGGDSVGAEQQLADDGKGDSARLTDRLKDNEDNVDTLLYEEDIVADLGNELDAILANDSASDSDEASSSPSIGEAAPWSAADGSPSPLILSPLGPLSPSNASDMDASDGHPGDGGSTCILSPATDAGVITECEIDVAPVTILEQFDAEVEVRVDDTTISSSVEGDAPTHIASGAENASSDEGKADAVPEPANLGLVAEIKPLDSPVHDFGTVTGIDAVTKEADIDTVEAREEAESRAYARLCIRFEQTRWKYQWELVSFDAARSARLRLCGRGK